MPQVIIRIPIEGYIEYVMDREDDPMKVLSEDEYETALGCGELIVQKDDPLSATLMLVQ